MKTLTQRLTGWLSVSVLALGLFAVSLPALSGVSATKHNLGTSGLGSNRVTDTSEICIFCHTPHGYGENFKTGPLWNKSAPASVYTLYSNTGSSSFSGLQLNLGPQSLPCLTCHDGTQALDNIVNAPGPGGMNVTGGGATGLTYTWTGIGGLTVDADGRFLAGIAVNLGSDLRNDHPVSSQFCGGGISGTAFVGCTDPDFRGGGGAQDPPGSFTLATANLGGTQVWWVNTSNNNVITPTSNREKTDIQLYTRNHNGATPGPTIECASCHDVHGTSYSMFLRNGTGYLVSPGSPGIGNGNSSMCLSCHIK